MGFQGYTQSKTDIETIENILKNQQNAWNQGDLEKFMDGYWQSDSLKFIGKNGITYGWKATLDRYRKGYPDKATMGTLQFTILHQEKISKYAILTIGKWHLKRDEKGDVEGYFSLLWRKIKGKWVICADHSS
jgi:hypothetical protein